MTTPPLDRAEEALIRYRAQRPSQFTARTIRDDYTALLGEISRLRDALGLAEEDVKYSRAECDRLRAELDARDAKNTRLRAALGAVDQLHQPRDHGGWTICAGCSRLGHVTTPWPCSTARTLDAARTPTS